MLHFNILPAGLATGWSYDDMLGFLPSFLDERDPRSAKEQINDNYAHGGGWSPLPGWTFDPVSLTIRYPGDPPYKALASAELHGDKLYLYQHEWLAIVSPDGSVEVNRMD